MGGGGCRGKRKDGGEVSKNEFFFKDRILRYTSTSPKRNIHRCELCRKISSWDAVVAALLV